MLLWWSLPSHTWGLYSSGLWAPRPTIQSMYDLHYPTEIFQDGLCEKSRVGKKEKNKVGWSIMRKYSWKEHNSMSSFSCKFIEQNMNGNDNMTWQPPVRHGNWAERREVLHVPFEFVLWLFLYLSPIYVIKSKIILGAPEREKQNQLCVAWLWRMWLANRNRRTPPHLQHIEHCHPVQRMGNFRALAPLDTCICHI